VELQLNSDVDEQGCQEMIEESTWKIWDLLLPVQIQAICFSVESEDTEQEKKQTHVVSAMILDMLSRVNRFITQVSFDKIPVLKSTILQLTTSWKFITSLTLI
jgi:hypothetical protein